MPLFLFSFLGALIPFVAFFEPAMSISCHEFKDMNTNVSMEYLKTMDNDTIFECLSYFGKDPLNEEAGKYIWDVVVKKRGSVQEVTDSDIKEFGWILQHIPAADMENLTLDEVDTIAALGKYHNMSAAQLQVLGQRVLEDWAEKGATDYTNYDLMTLQHILCGFNRTTIAAIHADAFKDAASILATLRGCPQEQLEALAELAVSPEAYGSPVGWSSSQAKYIGCILNGLSPAVIATIPPSGIETLTPDIIPCISPETLKAMTPRQLAHLTPSVVATLTTQQQAIFTSDQQRAVAEAYEISPVQKSTAVNVQGLLWASPIFLLVYLQTTVA